MNFLICLMFLTIGLSIADENAPVLMHFKREQFDNTITIGQTLNTNDFKLFLNKIKSVDLILVDDLSDEDLRMLLKQQEMPVKNVHYEPSVQSPAKTINNQNLKLTLTKLDTASKALNEFIAKLSNSNSDAIVLTRSDCKSRSKRQSTEVSNTTVQYKYVFGENCAAMFSSIYLRDQSSKIETTDPIYLNLTNGSFECGPSYSKLTLNFPGNATLLGNGVQRLELVFLTRNVSQYWSVDNNASLLVTSGANYGVYYYGAPYGMETPLVYSYVCTKSYFQLFNKTVSTSPLSKVLLYLEHFQIQPFNMSISNDTEYIFGRVNYCQGFFSSGIWMAISSLLILTTILAFGVSFLFGINTMDRFDDPKGKPLSIAIEK